jgi:membrane-associated phospholipid phosphatase
VQKLRVILAALLTTLGASRPAVAEPAPSNDLSYNPHVEIPLTFASVLVWLGSETVFKKNLAPTTCRWCDRDESGQDTLNGLDRWGRGIRAAVPQHNFVDGLSNAVAFGALPVAVLGAHALALSGRDELSNIRLDTFIVVETTFAALLLNQAVKFAIGRERPFVHALNEDQKSSTRLPTDNTLSFWSAHSTFAFAVVTSLATVSDLRGYSHTELIWALGLPIAAAVPLLRMHADRHYLTDVAVGSVVGAAFGLTLPRLIHPSVGKRASMTLSPSPAGLTIAGSF